MKIINFFKFYGNQLILSLIAMVLGIVIGIHGRTDSFDDYIKMVVPLAIGCGVLIIICCIISTLRIEAVAKRFNLDSLGNDSVLYDPLVIEIGYGLILLAEKGKGEYLPNQVFCLRKNIADKKGITVPKIRIVDSSELKPNQYRITSSYLSEVNLQEVGLSKAARTITEDLKNIIIRLYGEREKENEQYPSVADTIYNMYKECMSIKDIAKKLNRSESNIMLIIETCEMNEKLKEMGYGKNEN